MKFTGRVITVTALAFITVTILVVSVFFAQYNTFSYFTNNIDYIYTKNVAEAGEVETYVISPNSEQKSSSLNPEEITGDHNGNINENILKAQVSLTSHGAASLSFIVKFVKRDGIVQLSIPRVSFISQGEFPLFINELVPVEFRPQDDTDISYLNQLNGLHGSGPLTIFFNGTMIFYSDIDRFFLAPIRGRIFPAGRPAVILPIVLSYPSAYRFFF